MLSGELNRHVNLKRRLRSAALVEIKADNSLVPTSTGFIKKKTKPDSTTIVTPPQPGFTNSAEVLINGDKVEVTLPVKTKGWLWDTWKPSVQEFDNDAKGFQAFVSTLRQAGVDLDNRIDSTDDDIDSIQTGSTVITTIIQILQVSLSASQSLSGSDYTDFQMILSTVLAGLSLTAKYISTEVTASKTNSINLKVAVAGLEDSQNLVPPSTSSQLSSSAAQTLVPDAKITVSSASLTEPPGAFVPVSDALVVNGSEVDVTLPVQGSGCILKSWKNELSKIDNTDKNFKELIKKLSKLQVDLNNESNDCDNVNQFLQSLTSFGTAAIAIIQTAVAGSNISSTGLQIFQITISAFNTAASVATKLLNSTVTDLRNKTLTYSGDASELLVAQLRR
jgi:hypothetical protein